MTPVEGTKSFITVSQPAQGVELGKGCAPFPIHRGYRHYLRLYFLTRLLPTHANSCFLIASVTVYRPLTTIIFYVSR